jgi:demethylmenaquinone methyltransferase/2-methoxy-6-polyprenyl-1,4-benzoquinol methylase
LLPQQDPEFVRRTFGSISGRYDFANHLLSGGLDFLWRKTVAGLVATVDPGTVLDLATGSGDLSLAIRTQCPNARVVGADFCLPMLAEAKKKGVPDLVQADALRLPFRDQSFDAATVAFGLRNMASWPAALNQLHRVIRPGGLLLILDFSLPRNAILRSIYRIYLHHVLPSLAGLATGHPEAYRYLGESIEALPRGERMNAMIESSGFRCGPPRPLCLGIVALYSATRTAPNSLSNAA